MAIYIFIWCCMLYPSQKHNNKKCHPLIRNICHIYIFLDIVHEWALYLFCMFVFVYVCSMDNKIEKYNGKYENETTHKWISL